jgi:hypothetical protein
MRSSGVDDVQLAAIDDAEGMLTHIWRVLAAYVEHNGAALPGELVEVLSALGDSISDATDRVTDAALNRMRELDPPGKRVQPHP